MNPTENRIVLALRICAEGRTRFPDIDVPAGTIEQLLTSQESPSHPEELYLALACVAGNERAIAHLERSYVPPLRAVLKRAGVLDSELDDTLQRLRERLLMGTERDRVPRLTSYSGSGALGHWLRICAAREGIDRRRARRAGGSSHEELLDHIASASPELDHAIAQHDLRAPIRTAFRAAIASLEPRLAEALRRRVLDGLTSNQLAASFGVHRATVDRWLTTAREHVATITRRNLMQDLDIDEERAHSVIGLVSSQLDLSVSNVFGPPR